MLCKLLLSKTTQKYACFLSLNSFRGKIRKKIVLVAILDAILDFGIKNPRPKNLPIV